MSVWALLLAGNLCETSAPPSPQAAPTSLPHETNAHAYLSVTAVYGAPVSSPAVRSHFSRQWHFAHLSRGRVAAARQSPLVSRRAPTCRSGYCTVHFFCLAAATLCYSGKLGLRPKSFVGSEGRPLGSELLPLARARPEPIESCAMERRAAWCTGPPFRSLSIILRFVSTRSPQWPCLGRPGRGGGGWGRREPRRRLRQRHAGGVRRGSLVRPRKRSGPGFNRHALQKKGRHRAAPRRGNERREGEKEGSPEGGRGSHVGRASFCTSSPRAPRNGRVSAGAGGGGWGMGSARAGPVSGPKRRGGCQPPTQLRAPLQVSTTNRPLSESDRGGLVLDT